MREPSIKPKESHAIPCGSFTLSTGSGAMWCGIAMMPRAVCNTPRRIRFSAVS